MKSLLSLGRAKYKLFYHYIGLALVAILTSSVTAKDYLIRNATVYTSGQKGVLNNTDVLISDGFIMEVGRQLKSRPSYEVIDATGKFITPGLINAWTQIGLEEISAAEATVDYQTKNKAHSASFNIAPALNLNSTLIPHNKMNGLTRAIVAPSQGEHIFQGSGAAIVLMAKSEEYIKSNLAQFVRYGSEGAELAGGSRASAYLVLHQALSEADFLRNNRRQFTPGKPHQFSMSLQDLDALAPVLERKNPLVVFANRSSDIKTLIDISKEFKLKLVINGGAEAWMLARELALAEIPVILDPLDNVPSAFESLGVKLEGAAILQKAGVKLLFTNRSSHNAYLVRQSAGNAVAYGVSLEEAIKAMSINVAEVFGIESYGKIELGMHADLVIWDGDPLEITSNAERVFIKGHDQLMTSRATRLRDRFWDLRDIQNKAYKK